MNFDAFNEWERRSWEARAGAYALGVQRMTRGSVDALLDAVGAAAGTRLVDVGCGPGPLSAAAVLRGCAVTGIDVSAAMLAAARAAVPEATFREGSAEQLPAADAEFDAVCGNFVLPHVGHPVQAIREALRVVGAGGRVAFTDWDMQRAAPLRVFWDIVSSSGMPMPPGAPAGPDDDLGEPAQMERVLRDAGAVDLEVRAVHWTFRVDPDDWWTSVLESTPRTGARISAAPPEQQAELRARYDVEVARYERDGDVVVFPVVATMGVGTRARR